MNNKATNVMKRIILINIMLTLAAMALSGVLCHAQGAVTTIYVGVNSTTHLIFTSDLTYVDISNKELVGAITVPSSKNVLGLKAFKAFDVTTTISVIETNGSMHTFKVRYQDFPSRLIIDTRNMSSDADVINTQIRPESVRRDSGGEDSRADGGSKDERGKKGSADGGSARVSSAAGPDVLNVTSKETSNFGRSDAPTIEEIVGMKQKVFHIGSKCYGVECYCTNIYVYSDLTYLVFTIYNSSDIGFDADDAQFVVENLSSGKKALSTDRTVWPRSSYGRLSCPPKGTAVVGYTIPKMTLLKNECLRVYIYETRGTRNLTLTLTDKDLNYAVSPR